MSADGCLLLIEDDATTREVLTLLLEADGWNVRGVGSGEEALHALRGGEVCPRVMLCDLHLPGLQGPALAGELRAMLPGAALLAMSASEAGEAGAGYDAVLRKPFGPAALRAAMTGVETARKQWQAAESPAEVGMSVPAVSPAGAEGEGDVAGGLPVVAMETFLKLEQQMGARAKDLYAFALADAGDRLRRMERSLEHGDAAGFQAEAHALKGSAGMIGARRLAAMAAEAENPDARPGRGSSHHKLQRMHLAWDELRLMLETLFPI